MASVIVQGGNNPIQARTWQDSVRVKLLHDIYRHRGHISDLTNMDSLFNNFKVISDHYGHWVTRADVEGILTSMFVEGLIEAVEFQCQCCKSSNYPSEDILKHAKRFDLTQKGFDSTPEHIFP